jgi:hypothetical protein
MFSIFIKTVLIQLSAETESAGKREGGRRGRGRKKNKNHLPNRIS